MFNLFINTDANILYDGLIYGTIFICVGAISITTYVFFLNKNLDNNLSDQSEDDSISNINSVDTIIPKNNIDSDE
jgi:hypothetical protein